MDWQRVSMRELLEGLQEVDWGKPKHPADFFQRFTPPKDLRKLEARLKANAYYFRSNYLIIFVMSYMACLLWNPLALLALCLVTLAVLTTNDSFAASLNDWLLHLIRRLHPSTALKIRARTVHTGTAPLSTKPYQSRKPRAYILTLPRGMFVMLCLLGAGVLLKVSTGWRTLAWGTLLGLGLPLLHASFRSPNLKVKMANAKNEFKAAWSAWRENQMGIMGQGPTSSGFGVYESLHTTPDYTR